jgi:hypothetical protein
MITKIATVAVRHSILLGCHRLDIGSQAAAAAHVPA